MAKPHFNFDLVGKLAASVNMPLPAMRLNSDIMIRKIKFLTLDNTVSDFLSFMKKNRVRHVAIFDEPNESESKPFFVGIISEKDVLQFTDPYTDKAAVASEHAKVMKKQA